MILDGKKLQEEIIDELKERKARRGFAPCLTIISVGENPVSEKYLTIKKKLGGRLGIHVEHHTFKDDTPQEEITDAIEKAQEEGSCVIVQLPLPEEYNTQEIINTIKPEHDPDLLSDSARRLYKEGKTNILPPVVSAIREIIERHAVSVKDKHVVILGKGALVGAPARIWFEREGSHVSGVESMTQEEERKRLLKEADIIVSGTGVPHSIKEDEVKEGVIIFDAGTSESGGAIQGDVDPRVAEVASLFTPTPGGIGPLTAVLLFKNVLELTS